MSADGDKERAPASTPSDRTPPATTPGHVPLMSTTLESAVESERAPPRSEPRPSAQSQLDRTVESPAGPPLIRTQPAKLGPPPSQATPRPANVVPVAITLPVGDAQPPGSPQQVVVPAPPVPPPAASSPSPRSSAKPGSVRPLVVVDRVYARDRAGRLGRARGALQGLSIALEPGVHAVLGSPEDGTLALAEVLSGERSPTRGRVLVAGRDPARSSLVRSRMGDLGPEPRLPPAMTVSDAVRMAMRARGERGHRFDAVIDPLGLSSLHSRKIGSLAFAEARAVELAIALSTPAPIAVVLHEPLTEVALAAASLVEERIRALAATGACVIIITSSASDARTLADKTYVLHRGVIALQARGDGLGIDFNGGVELTVWVGPHEHGARKLAVVLANCAVVRSVTWEDDSRGGVVRLRGVDPDACALAVLDAAHAADVPVEAIAPTTPTLSYVRSATETLLRLRAAPSQAAAGQAAPRGRT